MNFYYYTVAAPVPPASGWNPRRQIRGNPGKHYYYNQSVLALLTEFTNYTYSCNNILICLKAHIFDNNKKAYCYCREMLFIAIMYDIVHTGAKCYLAQWPQTRFILCTKCTLQQSSTKYIGANSNCHCDLQLACTQESLLLRIIIKVPGGHVQAKELNFEGNIPCTHQLVQAHFAGEYWAGEVYCPKGCLRSISSVGSCIAITQLH